MLGCDEAFTEMFGYTAEELLGNSVLDQIHPEDQGRAVEGWLAVLSTGRDQQTRLRRRRKDGTYMWVDTTLRNLLNHPDRNYVLVEIIDISAEMQAQEALRNARSCCVASPRDAGRAAAPGHRSQRRLQQRPPAGDPVRLKRRRSR